MATPVLFEGLILQEEWKSRIKEAGGQVHLKIKNGLYFVYIILHHAVCLMSLPYISWILTQSAIADTNCLVVGGPLSDQDTEIKKAR